MAYGAELSVVSAAPGVGARGRCRSDHVRGVRREALPGSHRAVVVRGRELSTEREVELPDFRCGVAQVGEVVHRVTLDVASSLHVVAGVEQTSVVATRVLREVPRHFVAEHVGSDREAVLEPRLGQEGCRPIDQGAPGGDLILDRFDLLDAPVEPEPAIVARDAVVTTGQRRSEERATEEAVDVVVVVREDRVGLDERRAALERQLRVRDPVEVHAARIPAKIVVRQDAKIPIRAGTEEVAVVLTAASARPAEREIRAVAEGILAKERVVADERAYCLASAQRVGAVGRNECGAADAVIVRRVEVAIDPAVFAAERLRELVRARAAAFRDDLDDACGCIGTVERRGSGALHDLDRLDVIWVEVVEAVGALVEPRVDLAIVVRDTVDEDERLVGE